MDRIEPLLTDHVREDQFDRLLEDAELAVRDADDHAMRLGSGLYDPCGIELKSLHGALAELGRHHPGLADHLASLCDQVREHGMAEAVRELERYPPLVQALRLSLEIFTRTCFEPAVLEAELRERGERGDLSVLARELWTTKRSVLTALRSTLN